MMITHDVDEAVLLSDRIVMMTNGPPAASATCWTCRLRGRASGSSSSADPTYIKCRQRVLEFLYARHRYVEAAVRAADLAEDPRGTSS